MASEMLYPVMPIFLQHIGFSVWLIGLLEGLAEAMAGLSKPYFGSRSDAIGRRLPFVQLGYGLSAFSRPLMAVSNAVGWIFMVRTLDRLGKGIRTGARDALLSDESTPATRGRIFGFHRSMDTIGAVAGPALALLYLYFYPQQYRTLFILAVIPGIAATIATFFIKEKHKAPNTHIAPKNLFSFLHYWRCSPAMYKRLAIGLLFFALFNSSDAFLLLQLKKSGFSDTAVIAVFIFYNLVYALLAYPLGILADKIGMKHMLIIGLMVFAIVYAGFALTTTGIVFIGLFALYGFYAAATEGIAKAWISQMVPTGETATATGTFSGLQSLCALVASSLTGLLWWQFGSMVTFLASAIAAIIAAIYLSGVHTQKSIEQSVK